MKKSKLFQSALSLMLAGGMLTACGSSASSTAASTAASTGSDSTAASTASDSAAPAATKQYVIGIAEAQANDEVTTRRAYLEDFIAPTYNVKFIFSETLKDDAATKTFIENCIDSGVDAIIDMKSASGQMAQLCMDNGLVYTINGNYTQHPELLTTDYTNFAGCIGANNAQVGSLFGDWLEENASENGSEGFLISTSLAAQGNTQHVEITRAILEGLQQKYGITYTKSIDDLIASSETTNVENDKNILITLYPGSPNKDTWLPGISTLLQTGNYKMFLSSGQTYNQSATVVDEVEKSFGINIKVASVGALGTTLETAFNTKDSSGNSSVDLVAIKAVSTQTAAMFAATYNALVSGAECRACRGEDGLPVYFTFNFIPITSAEQLTEMSGWDAKETGNWIPPARSAFRRAWPCSAGWLRTIPAFLPITIPCLKQRPLFCMRWQLPGTKPCWWAGCTLSAPTSATALPAVWPRILPTADGCAHKKRWNRISACIPRRWAINGALMWSAAALRPLCVMTIWCWMLWNSTLPSPTANRSSLWWAPMARTSRMLHRRSCF